MFERCDPSTIAVFDAALAEARLLGHGHLGTEHLLVALVRGGGVLPRAVIELLPLAEVVTEWIAAVLGGRPPDYSEMLKTLGIDLDEVRAAVRTTFGTDAIERLGRRRVHQPWQPWRHPGRRCTSLLDGSISVAPRVKQALERACLDAERRHRALIDPAALLLGMVEVEDALSNRLLRDVGVDPSAVRLALLDATGGA